MGDNCSKLETKVIYLGMFAVLSFCISVEYAASFVVQYLTSIDINVYVVIREISP